MLTLKEKVRFYIIFIQTIDISGVGKYDSCMLMFPLTAESDILVVCLSL